MLLDKQYMLTIHLMFLFFFKSYVLKEMYYGAYARISRTADYQ